jgi:hypothetical protein
MARLGDILTPPRGPSVTRADLQRGAGRLACELESTAEFHAQLAVDEHEGVPPATEQKPSPSTHPNFLACVRARRVRRQSGSKSSSFRRAKPDFEWRRAVLGSNQRPRWESPHALDSQAFVVVTSQIQNFPVRGAAAGRARTGRRRARRRGTCTAARAGRKRCSKARRRLCR